MRILTTAVLLGMALPAVLAQEKTAPAPEAGQQTEASQQAKDTEKFWRIETSGIGG